ncbi:ParB/RepB/Spo0J family partition protein [Desulfosarcina sp. OttesenSCG-928-A07]|nr:ParB/RepB/Spo0J family partition protein [Desulfosarcina sp. OttesenSCG-928-A07]
MDSDVRQIAASQIDLSDTTFQITTAVDKTDLALSISAVGLLQFPILAETQGGFLVVCGFRRIRTLTALDQTLIQARVLPKTCSPLECACIAIADNSGQRPLNIVEQARAYTLIHKFTPPGQSWQEVARSVSLPDSDAAKNRIMPVTNMPDALQSAILEGSIALPVALTLVALTPDIMLPLISFLRSLNASLRVQRELLEMVREISLRDDIPVSQVIHAPDIAAIMEDPETPMPQKVQNVRQVFKNRRYPALCRAEKKYHDTIRALKADPRIQVQPPRDFEGKTYHITLAVHSRKDLDALWPDAQKLAGIIEQGEWLKTDEG